MERPGSGEPEARPRALGLRDLLVHAADRRSDAPAVLGVGRDSLSFGDLLASVDATAEALASVQLPAGTPIATVVSNGPEAAVSFLAVAAYWPCAPLNPDYPEAELDFYLRDLQAGAVVTKGSAGEAVREAARKRGIPVVEVAIGETGPIRLGLNLPTASRPTPGTVGDVALMLHTSGTTARPKLVPLTHANLLSSAENVARTLALSADDRCLNMMPLFHIHGIVAALLSSLSAGASVACTPGYSASRFEGWLDGLEPTWMTAVPTMYQGILSRIAREDGSPAGKLRLLRSSSASLPPNVMAELERVFEAPVVESYGMTEAAHQMASNPLPPLERKPGTVGIAAGPEIAILDPDGIMLPVGTRGEVAVRGDNVFGGYVANESANEVAFSGGWFRTGDEGCLDSEGYLTLTGRLKELINRGGEKIAPREVDEVLLEHPDVLQAVTFALPDERLGEEIAAAVVVADGARCDEAALQAHVAARLAAFKIPRLIVFVDEIPTGPTGKLQRIGLAERLGVTSARDSRPPAQEMPAAEPELVNQLARLAAVVLDLDEVSPDVDLFDLGLDSLTAAALVARAASEGLAPTSCPITIVFRHSTIASLAAALQAGYVDEEGLCVALRASGSRPPLFLVHGNDGGILVFRSLAERLGEDQPVYALRLPEDVSEILDVESLARLYVGEMRRLHPNGPYGLYGLCFGACVALEMARDLVESGEEVAVLGLVNPLGVPVGKSRRATQKAVHLARRSLAHARRGTLPAALRRQLSAHDDLTDVQIALEPMRRAYRVRPYPRSAAVFAMAPYLPGPANLRAVVRGGVEWVDLGGLHGEEMNEPYVTRIAAVLRTMTDSAS